MSWLRRTRSSAEPSVAERAEALESPEPAVTAIAAGDRHFMALKADGTVVVWGSDQYGQTAVPSDAVDVVAVTAGNDHCLALRRDGSVVAWGDNSYRISTIPDEVVGPGHFSRSTAGRLTRWLS